MSPNPTDAASPSSIIPPATPPSSTPTSPPSRPWSPTTNAIPLLPSSTKTGWNPSSSFSSSHYSVLHTLTVISLFTVQFPTLVANPSRTMMWALLPLALLQCAFCVACLPATGTWVNVNANAMSGGGGGGGGRANETAGSGGGGAAAAKTNRASGPVVGSLRKRPVGSGRAGASSVGGGVKGRVMPTAIALVLTLLLPPIPLTALAHVLGAPIYPPALIYHTAILSVHISLLAYLPLFYTHGVSGAAWRDVMAAWVPFDEAGVWGGSVGCLVGGWLGAIPIALDWDREWQAWPVTVLVGCYAGWGMGRLFMGPVILRGRRIDLSVGGGGGGQDAKKGDGKSR